MRIISIANQKGGCGKTTTAVNLAASLSENQCTVLLIDFDPQAHATVGLNKEVKTTIYDALSKLTPQKSNLEDITVKVADNFDLAPSGIILSTLEQELANEISRESRLKEAISSLKKQYDYIIIDCPPNLGILTINAICASREVIIPVEPSRFSIEGLSRLVEILDLIKNRLEHTVEYKVLVTIFDSRLKYAFRILTALREKFKKNVFSTIIHINVKLKESQSFGSSISQFAKYSRGAKDYYSLAREILTAEKTTKPEVALEEKMNRLLKKKLPTLAETVFTITAPEAQEVHLAGDFNNWQKDQGTMMARDNGVWVKHLKLKPGQYRYRFIIDGKWTPDPTNPVKEENPYGDFDSLLKVDAK